MYVFFSKQASSPCTAMVPITDVSAAASERAPHRRRPEAYTKVARVLESQVSFLCFQCFVEMTHGNL